MEAIRPPGIEAADRAVVFSPLPPERNGIADYTAELVRALRHLLELTVVVDDGVDAAPIEGVAVIPVSAYRAERQRWAEVPHLYQLGNNAGHVYMLAELLRRPGVVTLHDVSLHHLLDQATLRYGDRAAYARWLRAEHGEAGRVLAEQFTHRLWRGLFHFREMPILRRLLADAPAIVVHSAYAALKTRAQLPHARVHVSPHHLAPAADQAPTTRDRDAVRARLGFGRDDVLIVSLGFITRSKQLHRILRWMAARRGGAAAVRYIVVGGANREEFDFESQAAQLGLGDTVRLTGYADEEAFFDWVVASDIVVNLRYPSGGETSGVLVRAMGAGACVVVNDIGPFAELPDHCCVKVPASDSAPDTVLAERMEQLVADAPMRRRIGAAARSHVGRTQDVRVSARRYAALLKTQGGAPTAVSGPARLPIAELQRRLAQAKADAAAPLPLWLHDGLLPAAGHAQAALLVAGPVGDPWLDRAAALFGYSAGASRRCRSVDGLASAPARLDAALVDLRETGSALRHRPGWHGLRGRMRVGAALVVVCAHAESARRASQMLSEAGFETDDLRLAADRPSPPGQSCAASSVVLVAHASAIRRPLATAPGTKQRPARA